jgi:uncharacterized repeat protein (TIGR01451 family)
MLPVTVDIASGVTPGTSLEFQGVAASSTSDPNLSNNVGNSDTSVVSSAALSIRKTSDPATVNAGELVTYTITITNSGPSDARFVDVKEQLPSGLTLQSIIASNGGACAGTLCQFGTVHATRNTHRHRGGPGGQRRDRRGDEHGGGGQHRQRGWVCR